MEEIEEAAVSAAAAGDPAQAFEALRAEVAGLRQMLEAFGEQLAAHRGPDLTPTFGEFAKAQHQIGKKLAQIEQHPVIRMTGEQYRQTLVNAGTALVSDSARRVQEAACAVEDQAKQLDVTLGKVRTKRRQRELVALVAGVALLLGTLLSPFLARLLPWDLDTRVAALVMHQDRWQAGAQLMQAGNPDSYHELQAAANFLRDHHADLDRCREAAKASSKPQRCAITVSAE